jgi:hypothetical protein
VCSDRDECAVPSLAAHCDERAGAYIPILVAWPNCVSAQLFISLLADVLICCIVTCCIHFLLMCAPVLRVLFDRLPHTVFSPHSSIQWCLSQFHDLTPT